MSKIDTRDRPQHFKVEADFFFRSGKLGVNGKGLWVTMGGTRERDKGGVMLEGGCWEVAKRHA